MCVDFFFSSNQNVAESWLHTKINPHNFWKDGIAKFCKVHTHYLLTGNIAGFAVDLFTRIMNIKLKNAGVLIGWQILMWWIMRKIIYEPVSTRDQVVLDVFLQKLLPESSKGVKCRCTPCHYYYTIWTYREAINSNTCGIPQITITIIFIKAYSQYRDTFWVF